MADVGQTEDQLAHLFGIFIYISEPEERQVGILCDGLYCLEVDCDGVRQDAGVEHADDIFVQEHFASVDNVHDIAFLDGHYLNVFMVVRHAFPGSFGHDPAVVYIRRKVRVVVIYYL